MTSVSTFTPRDFTFSTSGSTTPSLGRRNSGIPYTSTPPALCSASKIVTSYPSLARSPAQVSPAGPEPITATFFPSFSFGGSGLMLFSLAQSATKRSSLPIATGSPLIPRMHFPSHWLSCGQTRPHTAGSDEDSLITL